MSSSQSRRDSQQTNNSDGRPRVEPSFFGNQIGSNSSSQSKQQSNDKRNDETDWDNPPPPYSPPEEPSIYPSTSNPSAPPLPETIPAINPNYQPHPTYSTSDSNIYPPHNYNQQPSSYGSIQQQQPSSPITSSPQNTSDVRNFHWPWRLQSAQTSTPPPPTPSSIHSTPITPLKKKRSCCRLFVIMLCILFVFLLISNIISSIFSDGHVVHVCTGGVPWTKIPPELHFQDNLRISATGGQLNGGRITFKNTNEEHPAPVILVKSRVSPANFEHIPGLDYSVIYNKDETHLKIQVPSSSYVCLSMDLEIYLNNKTQTIALDIQNSAIRIDGEDLPNTSTLQVKTTNAPIYLNSPWNGNVLSLETTNGYISLKNPVTANSTVSLRTTNNYISTAGITARNVISITSTNGYIKTGALTSEIVRSVTDNAALTVDSIHADQVELSTTNGKLMVPAGNITSTIKAKTTNAFIELYLRESNEEVVVIAETSNNPASLHMPDEFQGTFVIETTGHAIIVFDDKNTKMKTSFYEIGKGHLSGSRFLDKIIGGHISLKTTNSDPRISFQN